MTGYAQPESLEKLSFSPVTMKRDLLRMIGHDTDVSLRASSHPEFDAWRWSDYWVPMEHVIEFKRDVYRLALNELASHLHHERGHKPRQAQDATHTHPGT